MIRDDYSQENVLKKGGRGERAIMTTVIFLYLLYELIWEEKQFREELSINKKLQYHII